MRKISIAAALASAISLTAGACGGTAPGGTAGGAGGSGAIKIGTLHPLSGASAGDGAQLENGAKLAVEDINAAGGVKALKGAKLQLTSGDTQGKPDVGQSEAQRLIQSGAVALVGTYMSAVSANVAAVAERNKVPFVMDVTGDDGILKHGYKYAFRLQPPNSQMGTVGAQNLYDIAKSAGHPVKKVAYLHDQTAFGTSVLAGFKAQAAKLGFQVGPDISYDPASVSDLTTQITQVKASGADVLAVTGYYRDSVLAAKAVASVKPKLNAVFGVADGAFDQPQFPGDAGAAGAGYFDSNYRLDLKNPKAGALATLYQQRFHTQMRSEAALAYDAVRVIAAGLEKSGSRDRAKLRDAISGLSLDPTVIGNGPIKFNQTGQNVNALPVAVQVRGNTTKVVYPARYAEDKATPAYPATGG
jgi:branched-chain amino acid transport system substrate-binding protein